MKDISASLVKELRERTGVGMMDCKKALVESQGNIELAIEGLRKSSGVKAAKKANRAASDGVIVTFSNGSFACMVEVNCETDFVAKDESFIKYSEGIIAKLTTNIKTSFNNLMTGELEDKRKQLVQHLGENIVVRRMAKSDKESDFVGLYLHSNKRIASIVSLQGGNEVIAKDIAMHIVATDPISISPEDISEESVKKERKMFEAQSSDSGKPPEIINKIVEGKIKKYLSEVCLTEQEFVKEPSIKIENLLKQNNAKVISFERFSVGEGVEKRKIDFASEVMIQLGKT